MNPGSAGQRLRPKQWVCGWYRNVTGLSLIGCTVFLSKTLYPHFILCDWFNMRGSKFDNVFFSWWGDRGSKYRFNWANKMAFRWRADDGPSLNAGLVALRFCRGSAPVLQRNPIFFLFFRGGGGGGSHMFSKCFSWENIKIIEPWHLISNNLAFWQVYRLRWACAAAV